MGMRKILIHNIRIQKIKINPNLFFHKRGFSWIEVILFSRVYSFKLIYNNVDDRLNFKETISVSVMWIALNIVIKM